MDQCQGDLAAWREREREREREGQRERERAIKIPASPPPMTNFPLANDAVRTPPLYRMRTVQGAFHLWNNSNTLGPSISEVCTRRGEGDRGKADLVVAQIL